MNSSLSESDVEMNTDRLTNLVKDLRSKLEESEKKRKHVEDTLANIDMFNLSILDSLPAHIAVLDELGNIIYVNKAWVRFAHDNGAYSNESIGIGINYFCVCEGACGARSAEAAVALEGMLRVVRGEIEHFEVVYPCHSPTKDRWFLVYVTPYIGREKRCIVTTHIDITAMVVAEKAADEAKKQNELFVDLMSHDINNMNQAALGYLEMALQKLEAGNGLGIYDRMLIEGPLQSLTNSSALIDNVRTLQRLMTEGIKTKPVDLNHIFKELEAMSFRLKGREILINIPEAACVIVYANELLRDVFVNLIINAVKHSKEEQPLTVDVNFEQVVENGKRYCRCTVEDNGPGIPAYLKDKLFNRFQRGTTKAHGKGLGLYLVRSLVEGYGGRVWVEDRVPGDHTKGARFVVLLPAVEL